MIGRTVSHYRVLEKIGEGGMGEVYLAQDEKLRRRVALKFLPEHLTRDETRKQRFVQEARAAAAIEHPHIGAIYDIDEVDGRTFIAMEYVEGESLRQAVADRKLGLRKSVDLAIQISEGLAKAHERGVVHRDLKPENVLVAEEGYAKVIDFGLAKLLEPYAHDETGVGDAETATRLKTQEGLVLGTVAYMSPEQARGETVDARSDIFSFGAVLYEMLSGTSPFRRSTVVASLGAIANENPPELTLQTGETPPDLPRILRKTLAKDPTQRYQTMKDLAVDLREVREAIGSTTRVAAAAPVDSKPGWKKWAVAGAIVLVIAGLLGFSLLRREREAPGIGATGRPAIAVMYFEDHTGVEEIRWLSKGLPDMLLTGLAQTPGLDVVSSQRIYEVLKEIGQENVEAIDKSLVAEVARRSGAGAVVVGSIYKAGDDIRIDVQLQDVASGKLLGADSVRGADVFPLVDDLASRIRTRLDLTDRPAGRPLKDVTTPSLEAYRLYVEGLLARHNVRYSDARTFLEEALRIDPSFAMAYFQLSELEGALGDSARRREYLDRAIENLDRLPERQALMVEARQALERGESPEEAAKKLEDLIARYPDYEEAYDQLVHMYGRVGDIDKTIEFLDRWGEAFPGAGSGHFHNHRGYAFLSKGLYAEALRAFEDYARVSPDEPNPQDSLGEVYLITGRPEKALEHYGRALERDPSFGSSYLGRAFAYGMLGRYQDVLVEAGRLVELGERSNLSLTAVHFIQAFTRSRVGRYREAENHLRLGTELAQARQNVAEQVALLRLSAALDLERGKLSRVLETLREAESMLSGIQEGLHHRPVGEERHQAVHVHFLAGLAEARAGRVEAASARLNAQKEVLDPDDVSQNSWHHALAGEIALASGDLAAAEAAFVAGQPQPRMYFNLANTMGSVFSNNLPFRDGLARVKKARGDLEGAIEIYRQLNTADLSSRWVAMLEPRYVLETARLLDQAGDKEAARAEYRRFLELWKEADPDLPELKEARTYLSAEK
jgi:tetratricopeptide (TPR) repeat protein/tRNA A-37 threonylcarbamoyl transferase component Bud32